MDSIVQEYYELVQRFCSIIEGLIISEEQIEELMSVLLLLYEKALHLPNTEPNESDNYTDEEMKVLPLEIGFRDFYWEVFDPFDEDDENRLVCGMVFDDLNDIYRDLMEGVRAFKAGDVNEAVWLWKFGVDNHWGTHAVSLIKALHWLRTVYCILRRRADTGAFASGHSAVATDSALISHFSFNHYDVVFRYTLKQGVG